MPEPSNIHETNGDSVTVGLPYLTIEDTRRRLIALRNKHGADSPAGHRCSNIIEQLQNMRDAEGDQRGHLVRALERQMQELANLTASH